MSHHLAGPIDLALLSIREDEFKAVLQRFAPNRWVDGQRRYEIGVVPTEDGRHYRFAMVRPPEQGQSAAQDVARDIIEDLRPGWLLLIGIAGAVPSR